LKKTAVDQDIYPIFIASLSKPEGSSDLDTWLEPELDLALKQWKSWNESGELLKNVDLSPLETISQDKSTQGTILTPEPELAEEEQPKQPEVKTRTIIGRFSSLFKK